MSQLHLGSKIVRSILDGKRSAVLYPALADNVKYKVGDVIVVREPWAEDEFGDIIYQADMDIPKKIKWKPSIFMETSMARLQLVVLRAEKIAIQEISHEDVQKLGHDTLESLHKEWNVGLAKEKRPTLGAKFNPVIWLIEFEVNLIGTRN